MSTPIAPSAIFVSRMALAILLLIATSLHAEQPPLTAAKLFDPAHVVDIKIELPEEDWDEIRTQSRSLVESLTDEKAESPFTYVKGNVTINGRRITDVGIRKKGFLGSLDTRRPSLKIKFSEFKNQSPVEGLDRLTLNNNKQDPSRLSQYLSYKMFNETGTVASRCNFARVSVNGRSLGIYSNVESVKPMFLKRGFGNDSGTLFEGTVADFFVTSIERFEPKSKKYNHDQLARIAKLMEEPSVRLDALRKELDVEAFLRFWATESLIGFWDGYTNNQNNFFVYQNPSNSKLYFIPWGTDSAFTSSIPGPYRSKSSTVQAQSILANRLYRIPEIQTLYRQTLESLIKDHWKEAKLIAEVDRVEAMLKDDVIQKPKVFAAGVEGVRRFIRNRPATLQRELDRWPVRLAKGPRVPPRLEPIGSLNGKFTTQWYAKTPKDPPTVGKATVKFVLNGETVELEQLGVVAEPSRERFQAVRRPTLIFHLRRPKPAKPIILAMEIPPSDFQPSTEPVNLMGVMIEGNPLLFFARLMFQPQSLVLVGGTAQFDAAAMTPGAEVRGSIDLTVVKTTGGNAPAR